MNPKHRAIRANIKSMSPARAKGFVKAFNLRDDEEKAIIEIDVYNKSYTQFANAYHVTPEVIKALRQQAYAKIVDAIEYEKEQVQV